MLEERKEQQNQGGRFTSGCGPQELNVARKVNTDGFLICLDVVKTGPGEKCGLKREDIFVQFGSMHKKNFTGLEGLPNFLRADANQSIEVTVLRKVNQDYFRRIRLFLTPSNKGTIGVVLQVWPLPKPPVEV